MNNICNNIKKDENEKPDFKENLPFNTNILPDRFNSVSEPRFGGVINIGPEISSPIQVLIEISKINEIY